MLFDAATVILQALVPAPSSGVQLLASIRSRTRGRLSLSQSTVYPLLRSLAKAGLLVISVREKTAKRGRPPTYYALTAKGRARANKDRDAALKIFGVT